MIQEMDRRNLVIKGVKKGGVTIDFYLGSHKWGVLRLQGMAIHLASHYLWIFGRAHSLTDWVAVSIFSESTNS